MLAIHQMAKYHYVILLNFTTIVLHYSVMIGRNIPVCDGVIQRSMGVFYKEI